jgi:hypothetical protein
MTNNDQDHDSEKGYGQYHRRCQNRSSNHGSLSCRSEPSEGPRSVPKIHLPTTLHDHGGARNRGAPRGCSGRCSTLRGAILPWSREGQPMSKNIVIFSDGTRQEGGEGNPTNVYEMFRMMENRTPRQVVVIHSRGSWRWQTRRVASARRQRPSISAPRSRSSVSGRS